MPEVTHLIQADALPAGVDAMAFPSRGEGHGARVPARGWPAEAVRRAPA
jgi:hypothetical protein